MGKGKDRWTLPLSKLLEYVEAYPHLEVEAEIRKARQYVRDKPAKRKTANGMLSYLTGWLNRCQNRGAGDGHNDPLAAKHPDSSGFFGGD